MALKIRAWDRHENCDGLNRLMGSHPPSDDYISNNNSFTKLTMNTAFIHFKLKKAIHNHKKECQ